MAAVLAITGCQFLTHQVTPDPPAQAAANCEASITITDPIFTQVYPVHFQIQSLPAAWVAFTPDNKVDTFLIFDSDPGGALVQFLDQIFEPDSIRLYDNSLSTSQFFSTNLTAYLYGTAPYDWNQDRIRLLGDPNNIPTQTRVVLAGQMITTTDVADFPTLIQILESTNHLVTFGQDSTETADALQHIIDNCIAGGRLEYHQPIAPFQLDSLGVLGWQLLDQQ